MWFSESPETTQAMATDGVKRETLGTAPQGCEAEADARASRSVTSADLI
jgi:hypothetical protein